MADRRVEFREDLATANRWNLTYISSATTTVIKAAPGTIGFIAWDVVGSGQIDLYDDPATTGNQKGSYSTDTITGQVILNGIMNNGITIVTTGTVLCTVGWR
jgi:hypothetical protein